MLSKTEPVTSRAGSIPRRLGGRGREVRDWGGFGVGLRVLRRVGGLSWGNCLIRSGRIAELMQVPVLSPWGESRCSVVGWEEDRIVLLYRISPTVFNIDGICLAIVEIRHNLNWKQASCFLLSWLDLIAVHHLWKKIYWCQRERSSFAQIF